MPSTDYATTEPAEAIERALNTHVGDEIEDLVDPQIALTAVHVPGTPLERRDDRDSTVAFERENAACVTTSTPAAEEKEYLGVDTRSAAANYATRSNIVPA